MPEIGVKKVILIGRIGADTELKDTSNGKAAANFFLAVNESFKNGDGEQREHVEWIRCVVWGRLALALVGPARHWLVGAVPLVPGVGRFRHLGVSGNAHKPLNFQEETHHG